MKKICYFLQNVGETTRIVVADKEEEGRGDSLIQHEFNLVGAMKKIGVTVVKEMVGVGIPDTGLVWLSSPAAAGPDHPD